MLLRRLGVEPVISDQYSVFGKDALPASPGIGLALRWKTLTLLGSEVPNSPPFCLVV
jgi:hypothetical protein